jgi:DNA polymerase-3 subunit epsilon
MMTKPFQHLRLTRPLTMADLETTGLSPSRDRIIEIGAVKFLPSGERRRFRQRVNPGGPIPPAATEVHGITDADVADCPVFRDVARRLARFLRDSDLGGFNLKNFDLPFLIAEFSRVGISFPLGFVAVIDVQEIYHERERRDLGAAVRYYLDREHANAHSAVADAHAAAAVLDAQLLRYDDLPRTVVHLHERYVEADIARRLRRDERGQLLFNFGKCTGMRVDEVACTDPGYLEWLLRQDFLPDFTALIQCSLRTVRV